MGFRISCLSEARRCLRNPYPEQAWSCAFGLKKLRIGVLKVALLASQSYALEFSKLRFELVKVMLLVSRSCSLESSKLRKFGIRNLQTSEMFNVRNPTLTRAWPAVVWGAERLEAAV